MGHTHTGAPTTTLLRTDSGYISALQFCRASKHSKPLVRAAVMLVLTLGFIAAAAAAVAVLARNPRTPPAGYHDAKGIEVVVQPGDTLWSIARSASNGSIDHRGAVDLIRRANGLESIIIRPGQTLVIPPQVARDRGPRRLQDARIAAGSYQ